MASGYDLSLTPDSRFLKLRQNFTTGEHMMELHDLARARGAARPGSEEAIRPIIDRLDGSMAAFEDGIWAVVDQIQGLREDLREGFRGMERMFSWGIARLCWQHEQDRQVYREILGVLEHPLQTQALELRERAERAIANKWWEEAATDLQAALADNRYDYLAHLQLGQVMWFQFVQPGPAMEQCELAAKYADAVGASEEQKYFAALGYGHVAYLWRVDAQAYPERAGESYSKAERAARRGIELAPTVLMPLHELVLSLLGLGQAGQARDVMEAAVRRDETLLLGLEGSPETAGRAEVQEFVRGWRARYSDAVGEARAIFGTAAELLASCVPGSWATQARMAAEASLAGDHAGPGTTPRRVVLDALAPIEACLQAAGTYLSERADRAGRSAVGVREAARKAGEREEAAGKAVERLERECPGARGAPWSADGSGSRVLRRPILLLPLVVCPLSLLALLLSSERWTWFWGLVWIASGGALFVWVALVSAAHRNDARHAERRKAEADLASARAAYANASLVVARAEAAATSAAETLSAFRDQALLLRARIDGLGGQLK